MIIKAILIPLIRAEIPRLKDWLRECPEPGMSVQVYLTIDSKWSDAERSELTTIAKSTSLHGSSLIFIDCEIPSDLSFYEKTKATGNFDTNKYKYGLKSGPNIQFFSSLRKIRERCEKHSAVLLLETDAHPMKKKWLLDLNMRLQWLANNIYIAGARPLIASVVGTISNHINGNAVYHVGKDDFYDFLSFWEELLLKSVMVEPDLAYDTVLEWSYHMLHILDEPQKLSQHWNSELGIRVRKGVIDISPYIGNLSGLTVEKPSFMDGLLLRFPQLLIAHGKIFDDTGLDLLRTKKSDFLN
jgi:hypothetical protein